MSEAWRKIETAPTDDPSFVALACNPSRSGDGWDYYLITRHDIGGRYECWVVPPGRPVGPTHWQPVPPPPADGAAPDPTKVRTPNHPQLKEP
jgi:hypothetical protein